MELLILIGLLVMFCAGALLGRSTSAKQLSAKLERETKVYSLKVSRQKMDLVQLQMEKNAALRERDDWKQLAETRERLLGVIGSQPVFAVIAMRENAREPVIVSWNEMAKGEHQVYEQKPIIHCWPNIPYRNLVELNQKLVGEIRDLKDILVCVTRHDGALEEYKPRWLPIVERELNLRAALPTNSEAGMVNNEN